MSTVHIFYGSETGTAQSFAETLEFEAGPHAIKAEAHDLAEFGDHTLDNVKVAVFVVATYGDGEPTRTAENFLKFLQRNLKEPNYLNKLAHLKYTVFACGDSSYPKYCEMGRLTDKYIEKLGGVRIYRLGEGNAGVDIDGDFDSWKSGVWSPLKVNTKD